MAWGDTDVSIVENPTAASVATAMDVAIAATNASAAVTITALGMGHGILITAIENAGA